MYPATAPYTIIIQAPSANVGGGLADICKGGISAPLGGSVGGTATGGTWSDGGVGGTFNSGPTNLNTTWTPPANYTGTATLTLTTSGGSCGTTTASKTQLVDANCQIITLTQPAIAVTVSASKTNVSCAGAADGTITVSGVSAGATYIIQLNGAGADLSGQSTFGPGTYVVTASAPNGNNNGSCTATASVTITEPNITVTANSTNVTCNGAADGTITLSGLSPNTTTIIQKDGIGADLSGQTTFGPGTYVITATGPNGNNNGTCMVTTSVTITEQPELNGDLTSFDVSCHGNNDAKILIDNPTGGYGTYEYSIDGGSNWQSNGHFLNLTPPSYPAIYNVQMRDAAHPLCIKIFNPSLPINEPEAVVLSVSSTNVSCNGAADGTITASSTGGAIITILKDGTGADLSGQATFGPGSYTVTATADDANFIGTCTDVEIVNITEPLALSATISGDATICSGQPTTITVTIIGRNSSIYSYL